jgi:predicted transcriptional regulator
MKPIPKDKKAFNELMEDPRFARAIEMRSEGNTNAHIAKVLGVHMTTVSKWWTDSTLPPRNKFRKRECTIEKPVLSKAKARIEAGESTEEVLESYTDDAAIRLREQAQVEEDKTLASIAESQATAADKYQHYIAAAGIKLLRDSMSQLRGPKSVRELSELDQLIRRNLGLNSKTGGGNGGKMQIDISILNNGLADRGDGALSKMKKDAVDARVVEKKK